MNFGKQIIALGGMMIFAGSLLPITEAQAFGQQWRPASGFSSAQPHSFQRVANMPSFRPRPGVAAQPNAAAPRFAQYTAPRYAPYPAYSPGYASPPPMVTAYGYPPQASYYAPAMPPATGWPQPFGYMAQSWQQQVPLFVRQFAWRPAGQPWLAAASDTYHQPARYQARMAPQMSGFRPSVPSAVPTYGSWRPAVAAHAPAMVASRYAYPAPVYTGQRYPASRSYVPPVWSPAGDRVAGYNPAPSGISREYWRPDSAALPGGAWQGANSRFRPAAYGRSGVRDERLAARADDDGSSFARDRLPGWVTTYQEADFAASCGWCGGS